MRKAYQGVLSIIIGSAFLMNLWVLSNYLLVGGTTKQANIMHPHPTSIPIPIAYFLFFGGVSLIIFSIWLLLKGIPDAKKVN